MTGGCFMKKLLSVLLAALLLIGTVSVVGVSAAEEKGAPSAYAAEPALYVHAVMNSADTEAWHAWQSVHDEDFEVAKPNEKYFFLPSSVGKTTIDVYNGYDAAVTLNGVTIASKATESVAYTPDIAYTVSAGGQNYTLKIMNSNAEGAIYINNPDADGNGTDLMSYLNDTKENSAKATGAIVTPDGAIDNTTIKKIAFNEKKADGYNPMLTVADEMSSWSAARGLKQYEVMKSAMGARPL